MNTKHSQKKRYTALALLLSVVMVISLFLPMTAFAASSDAEVLTLREDEPYRFFCQTHNQDENKCRVICIVKEEWLKNTPDFAIYLTAGNAYGRKETKSIGQPTAVYRSIKANEGDRVITYTPQEGALLFGWIVTNLPEGFSMKSADISSLEGPYTVTFTDADGRVIQRVTDVPKGGSAPLPQNPTKDNATFLGWSGTYVGVTKNETVRAVYDDETNVFCLSDAEGAPGTTVTVTLSLKGKVALCAMNISLVYGSSLELVDYDNDLSSISPTTNPEKVGGHITGGVTGIMYMTWAATDNKTKKSDIIEITFKIPEEASGVIPVTILLNTDVSYLGEADPVTGQRILGSIEAVTVSGHITVTP